MALKRALGVVTEMARRPGYREYVWYRLLRKLGYAAPDRRWAGLRLPDQIAPQMAQGPAHPPGAGSARLASISNGSEGPGSREQAHRGATGKVRDRLFDTSPYANFDAQSYPDDLQGWGSDDPVLTEAVELLRPARVCEVGSWKGRSAIRMAQAAKTLHLNTEIVCVDTWLGSPEHWLREDQESYASLRILNGMPHLYYTFLANVVRAGVSDVITPFPMTSENAAEIFAKLGVRFDLIYIDAAHEYGPAKRDIAAYYELLADDGLLIGDDYISWPGVTRAVDEFVAERNLRVIGMQGKVIIPKGEKYANIAFN
jgi:predicted O-methyltransferase YrrM